MHEILSECVFVYWGVLVDMYLAIVCVCLLVKYSIHNTSIGTFAYMYGIVVVVSSNGI